MEGRADACTRPRTLACRHRPEPAVRQCADVSGAAWSARYEIRVAEVLDQRWTAWFDGLAIESDHSQTVISGPVADQAALRGLLDRVCDLGLVVISVRRLDPA